jgi:hypothetical protein
MSAETELLIDLLGQHRTKAKPYEAVVEGWQLMQCSACDGNTWKIVRPGDPTPECSFWQRAKEMGLVH